MLKNIIKKILTSIPIILGVVTLIFFLLRLNGINPVYFIAGDDASEEVINMLMQKYGFDKPLHVQWWIYITTLLKGDFGSSITSNRPILPDLLVNFKYTIELLFSSMFIAVILGVPFGIITAVKQNTFTDHAMRIISLIGTSMPHFWFAILLLRAFAIDIPIFPVMGTGEGFWDVLWHLVLPSVTLGFSCMALITRMTRTSMLEVMGEQYMVTAKAKGLPYKMQILRHAFKNASIPVVTVIGVQMGRQLSMGMVVEATFYRPGLGTFLQTAITNLDYPTIQGTVIFCSLVLIVINILVDICYCILDPRIKF